MPVTRLPPLHNFLPLFSQLFASFGHLQPFPKPPRSSPPPSPSPCHCCWSGASTWLAPPRDWLLNMGGSTMWLAPPCGCLLQVAWSSTWLAGGLGSCLCLHLRFVLWACTNSLAKIKIKISAAIVLMLVVVMVLWFVIFAYWNIKDSYK